MVTTQPSVCKGLLQSNLLMYASQKKTHMIEADFHIVNVIHPKPGRVKMDLALAIVYHNILHLSMTYLNRIVIPLSPWPQDSPQLFPTQYGISRTRTCCAFLSLPQVQPCTVLLTPPRLLPMQTCLEVQKTTLLY